MAWLRNVGQELAEESALPGVGYHSRDQLQRKLIGHLLNLVGDLAYELGPGSGRRVGLEGYLQQTVDQLYPMLSTRHLRRWFYHFLLFGETPEETKKRERGRRRNVPPCDASRWTDNDTNVLKDIVDRNPDYFLDEIQDDFVAATNKYFAYSTLWTKLDTVCNYSLQVATYKAVQQNEQERLDYEATIERIVAHPSMLIFIDETAKGRNASRRRRSWSMRGITPVRTEFFVGANENPQYTMIGAGNIDGFVDEACEIVERARGDNDMDVTRGTVDRERFDSWAENKLAPCLGDFSKGEPNSICVCDNATLHHNGRLVEICRARGAIVIYLPPYSPEKNPIELFFLLYKKALQRYSKTLNWYEAHLKGLESVTPESARSFFRKCNVPGCERVAPAVNDDELVVLLAVGIVAAGIAFSAI